LKVYAFISDIGLNLLECHTYFDSEENIVGPRCTLFPERFDNDPSMINYNSGYLLNISDIGSNKMVARKANGDIVEGYKLDYKLEF